MPNPHDYSIAASLLAADFARLGEDATAMLKAGADRLHFDVMDHDYVPNLTIGPCVLKALRHYGITAPIDVHLMTRRVEPLCEAFAQAGATSITFHPETVNHVDRTISLIHALGCEAGLALNPSTPLCELPYVCHHLDYVLIMSVNPGFGGQSFIEQAHRKIKEAAQCLQAHQSSCQIAVDGGVTRAHLKALYESGARQLVMGSALFGSSEGYQATLASMRKQLSDA